MIALAKPIFNQDIIFILLSVSFLLLAVLRSAYWKHAKLLLMGVFAQRYANQFLREENAFTERVSFLTFALMVINFSVIILKLIPKSSIIDVFYIVAGVVLFFLFKIIVMRILGHIFKVKDVAKLGVFFSLLFDRSLGIFLFPFIVVLYFFSVEISAVVLIAIAVIFIVLLVIKLFWLWKIGTNVFGFSQLYIFLYLCALEISPLLLLGKGVVY